MVGCSSSPLTRYQDNINSFIVDENLVAVQSIESPKAINFKVLNDHHIAITSKHKSYLLTTPENCHGMFHANKIIIANDGKEVVQANIDKIVRLGENYTECTITGIYKLHPVQLQRLNSWLANHQGMESYITERS